MFCPKCGAILIPKRDSDKKKLACSSCGYSTTDVSGVKITEKVSEDAKIKNIEVIGDEEERVLPVADADCPKCKNKKAYYWLIQTRASDEPETRFFRCTKCKFIWREYI